MRIQFLNKDGQKVLHTTKMMYKLFRIKERKGDEV